MVEASQVLAFQFALSLIAYAAIGLWFVLPWLKTIPRARALTILVFPQTFRFIGVTLLVPGVVGPGLPEAFARPTATGDTVTTALAWLALIALRSGWRLAIPAVWLLNVVGLGDLLMNVSRGVRLQAAPHLGAAWFVPAFIVPAMLVVHVLIFAVLLRGNRGAV